MSRSYKCPCGYESRKAAERDLHNRVCAKGSLGASSGSAAWPDIGKDPLKTIDFDLGNALERLRKGTGLQQKEVPDQTQLAWRIDVSRALGEIARLQGLTNALRKDSDRLEYLGELLKNCPHTHIGNNDDEDAEGDDGVLLPIGYTIRTDGCQGTDSVTGKTLREAIDMAMNENS